MSIHNRGIKPALSADDDALSKAPPVPSWLSVQAKAEWKRIMPQLIARQIITRADLAGVENYVTCIGIIRQIETERHTAALTDIFMSMMNGSMTASEALKGLLLQMLKVAAQKKLMAMFESAGAGSFMGFIGGLLGYDGGGYTGNGPKLEPAGVVHRGEFVMSKAATQRLGVENLERLHTSALRGYDAGGAVGVAKLASRASGGSLRESGGVSSPSVTINAPVTVNASGGTPEQNNDLAKQIARETEQSMRAVVRSEIGRQFRPGAMLNKKG